MLDPQRSYISKIFFIKTYLLFFENIFSYFTVNIFLNVWFGDLKKLTLTLLDGLVKLRLLVDDLWGRAEIP